MNQPTECFSVVLLVGRPASGKSEILDYLTRLDPGERRRRFHVGTLVVLDDFPMLWSWFEEDRILSELGKPRLHTDADGYFREPYLWDVLIRRLCLEYDKLRAGEVDPGEPKTAILEFARGSEHGGYARAFSHLSPVVSAAACVVYVRVSYAESSRKNRRRFNPARPHSILEHSLPEAKLERLYRDDDWENLAGADSGALELGGCRRPYAVFENEDDLTTRGGGPLGRRLKEVLGGLWARQAAQHAGTSGPAAGPAKESAGGRRKGRLRIQKKGPEGDPQDPEPFD